MQGLGVGPRVKDIGEGVDWCKVIVHQCMVHKVFLQILQHVSVITGLVTSCHTLHVTTRDTRDPWSTGHGFLRVINILTRTRTRGNLYL